MVPPKSILFDCDGVLVDTEIVAARVVVRTLGNYGINLDIKAYMKEFSGRKDAEIIAEFSSKYPNALPAHLLEEIELGFDRAFETELELITGAKEMLASITIPKAVVSNSVKKRLKHNLYATGLNTYFNDNQLFSAEFVPKPKPSPDVYLYALEGMGFFANNTMAVEDSLAGIEAATRAGLKVVAFGGASHIQEGHEQKALALGAFTFVKTMEELSDVIGQWANSN